MKDKKVTKKGKNVHLAAKREMAGEKARMSGRRKTEDPRVIALEKAAEVWKNKKEKKVQVEIERLKETTPGLEIVDIKPEKYKTKGKKQSENQGVVGWLQKGIRDFQKKLRREKSSRKSLNTASIGAIARRLVAREKAKIRGKRFPYPRISSFL